jgi:outer membrane biosynthesis protein TonB
MQWRLVACCLVLGSNAALVWPQAIKQATAKIRVSADVAAARLDHIVEPVYPKDANVQGTIVLHAVIDTDGSIESMEYVSGPTRLMRAALDAAHLWHYRPMRIDGQPVEMDTTINVVFALDGQGHLKPQPRILRNVAGISERNFRVRG